MNAKELFRRYKLYDHRMISHSKSWYRWFHPCNLVVFNASLQVMPKWEPEFWIHMCDLDLTKEKKKLEALSKQIEGHIFVYSEHGAYLYAHFFNGKMKYRIAWHPIAWAIKRILLWPYHRYRWWRWLKRYKRR